LDFELGKKRGGKNGKKRRNFDSLPLED